MRLGMTGQASRGRRPRCRLSHARTLRPCPLARPGTIPPFVQLNSSKGPNASASWTQLIMLDTIGQIAEPYGSVQSYVLMVGATGIEPVTPTMSTLSQCRIIQQNQRKGEGVSGRNEERTARERTRICC